MVNRLACYQRLEVGRRQHTQRQAGPPGRIASVNEFAVLLSGLLTNLSAIPEPVRFPLTLWPWNSKLY